MLKLRELERYEITQVIASEGNKRLWMHVKCGEDVVTYHVENMVDRNTKAVEFMRLDKAVGYFNTGGLRVAGVRGKILA